MRWNEFFQSEWVDCFIAGLPAGCLLKMSIDDLRTIVRSSRDDAIGFNATAEVCLIGLVSHFEAFCKNQFASVVNLCPQTLTAFCERRPDAQVRIADLLEVGFDTDGRIGSLLAEGYDFGSPKAINSLYCDLLRVTPFSVEEARKYERLLEDRNLLVHHAGIYTLRYHRQRLGRETVLSKAFMGSLEVRRRHFALWAGFLERTAIKVIGASHRAVVEFVERERIRMPKARRDVLECLRWYE